MMKTVLFVASLIAIFSSQNGFARGGERQSFAEIDSNSDGRLSLEEFMKMPEKRFKRIDTNNDGFIQAEELEAMHEMRRDRHK